MWSAQTPSNISGFISDHTTTFPPRYHYRVQTSFWGSGDVQEALIVVLDVGASMSSLRPNSKGLSGLDKSKKAIRLLIQQKLLFFKKTYVVLQNASAKTKWTYDEIEPNQTLVRSPNAKKIWTVDLSEREKNQALKCAARVSRKFARQQTRIRPLQARRNEKQTSKWREKTSDEKKNLRSGCRENRAFLAGKEKLDREREEKSDSWPQRNRTKRREEEQKVLASNDRNNWTS